MRKDGLVPQNVRDKIISITRERLRNPKVNQNPQHISYSDLAKVLKLLKEEHVKSQTSGK